MAVIAFFWWQKRKSGQLLNLVTYQIHTIKDQAAYDELTNRIQNKTQEVGFEPALRDVLRKKGILGEESWQPPKESTS